MKTITFTKKLTILSLIFCAFNITYTSYMPVDIDSSAAEKKQFTQHELATKLPPHPAQIPYLQFLTFYTDHFKQASSALASSHPQQNASEKSPRKLSVEKIKKPKKHAPIPICDMISKGYSLTALEAFAITNPKRINERNIYGYNALHWIADHGLENHTNRRYMVKKAQLMLRLNVDPHAVSNEGETPLQIATRKNYTALMQILAIHSDQQSLPSDLSLKEKSVSHPQSVESSNPQKRKYTRPEVSPIFHKIKTSSPEDLKQFLRKYPESVHHRKTQTGYTPLHIIAKEGQNIEHMLQKAKLLLQFNANPLILSTHLVTPETPLHVAHNYKNKALVDLLITHIKQKSASHITPAIKTPSSGSTNPVMALVADPSPYTPLHLPPLSYSYMPPHPALTANCLMQQTDNNLQQTNAESHTSHKKQKTKHQTIVPEQFINDFSNNYAGNVFDEQVITPRSSIFKENAAHFIPSIDQIECDSFML